MPNCPILSTKRLVSKVWIFRKVLHELVQWHVVQAPSFDVETLLAHVHIILEHHHLDEVSRRVVLQNIMPI